MFSDLCATKLQGSKDIEGLEYRYLPGQLKQGANATLINFNFLIHDPTSFTELLDFYLLITTHSLLTTTIS